MNVTVYGRLLLLSTLVINTYIQSGPQFRVKFGSGRVESLHLWVGLGRVKIIGPTSNSGMSTGHQTTL